MNNNNGGGNNLNWTRSRITDNTVSPSQDNKYMQQGMDSQPMQSQPVPYQTTQSQTSPYQTMPSQGMPFQQTETTDTIDRMYRQGPPPVMDRLYIPGYLASNIGKNMLAEFLIGNNTFTDKSGKLLEVGVNYFVLEDYISKAKIMCDLYSVRFVTI